MKTKLALFIFLLLSALVTVSCSEDKVAEDSSSTGSNPWDPDTGETDPDPDVDDDAILFLKIATRWESDSDSDSNYKTWQTCQIPNNYVQTDLECSVSVPEARLYYSHVKFSFGTYNTPQCPLLYFTPYYYKRSSDAPIDVTDTDGNVTGQTGGYKPPGWDPSVDPGLDCSGSTKEKQCYGGAAPALIDAFPKNTGLYYLTSVSTSASLVLAPENVTRMYGGYWVNYLLTNDISSTGRGTTVTDAADERVAGSFHDYGLTCRNYWGEALWTMKLTFSDENMDGDEDGSYDEFTDWD